MELIAECRNETLILQTNSLAKQLNVQNWIVSDLLKTQTKNVLNLIPFIIPMSLRLTQNYPIGKFEHQPKLGIISAEWQYHEFVDNR